jgi:hypothetical protein
LDLRGRTVIPGFNDSHIHPTRAGGFYASELRRDGLPSLALGLVRIREHAARTPAGQWIRVIGGWSPYHFEEQHLSMSAGSGVTHSEYNPSRSDPVHFLQIWLLPNAQGVAPGYAQRHFPRDERRGRWVLLVSPDGREQSLPSNQAACLHGRILAQGEKCELPAGASGRRGYLHVVQGELTLDDQPLMAGDGVYLDAGGRPQLQGGYNAELLYFDLP